MAQTSNIAQVIAWLDAWLASFDFTRVGIDQSLGRDIGHTIIRGPSAGITGAGILGRAADGKGPDGTPWPKNSKDYAKFKERKYGWSEVNRRTGQMLAEQSFQIQVQPDLVQIVYGWDIPPDRSAAPTGYISDADEAVTDRQKAEWAHKRGRPFMGWNAEDYQNVLTVCQASIDVYIRETNAKNRA